jgi:hypothetical protein
MINADPLFVDPPYVSDDIPTVPGTGWFWDALDPRQLGNRLQLQWVSPAINTGIDPTTLTTDPALQAGLRQYVYQDIVGVPRPQAGAFDLGAYEYRGVLPTPTTTPTFTSTPTITQTSTPTPTSVGVIRGHVIWQAIPQPDPRNTGITATLTICPGASATPLPLTYSVATDPMGFFMATTHLPDGTYTWAVKGIISLANRGTLTLLDGTANQEMGSLQAGDANNSNAVEVADFTVVRNTFGKRLGDPGYDSRGDFDRTNVVGVSDYTLLKGNFAHGGAATTCP